MPYVSNEALAAFNEGFEVCQRRVGGGRIAIDTICLRKLIHDHKDAAFRFVELHCVLAESQPGYLQPAMMVATAYHVEFDDTSLLEMVKEASDRLGAEEHLKRIGVFKTLEDATAEPPERTAAKAWWESSARSDGHCDNCNDPMRRGEGYLIKGRAYMLGDTRIDMGEEIVCQKCFNELRGSWNQR